MADVSIVLSVPSWCHSAHADARWLLARPRPNEPPAPCPGDSACPRWTSRPGEDTSSPQTEGARSAPAPPAPGVTGRRLPLSELGTSRNPGSRLDEPGRLNRLDWRGSDHGNLRRRLGLMAHGLPRSRAV